MTDEPLIPPTPWSYHDAPDPDRPYTVDSPVVTCGLLVTLVLVMIAPWPVLAAFCACIGTVANTPGLLRSSWLARLERHLMVLARRRRALRLRWWKRKDRVLFGLMRFGKVVRNVAVIFGVASIVLTPVLFLVWSGAGIVAFDGLFICALGLLANFWISCTVRGYAASKGDEPTGPMHFYKTSGLADWLERNPARALEVQRWSVLLAFGFAVIPAVIGFVA